MSGASTSDNERVTLGQSGRHPIGTAVDRANPEAGTLLVRALVLCFEDLEDGKDGNVAA